MATNNPYQAFVDGFARLLTEGGAFGSAGLVQPNRPQNAAMFGGDPDKVPKRALTMGVGTILDARELLLLATGGAKASILAKAVEGPITAMISASAIQLHPNCKVIIDEDAARELKEREYYDWIFQNEPEWQEFRA